MHVRARLPVFRFAPKSNTVVCIAGVVVDMYGLDGTKWDQGAEAGPPAAMYKSLISESLL